MKKLSFVDKEIKKFNQILSLSRAKKENYVYNPEDLRKIVEQKFRNIEMSLQNVKQKILIVDDEPHITDLIKLSLNEKYSTIEAYCGREAIIKAQSESPDAIVLDITMPKMSGFEVCQILKNDMKTKDIPIVFLSAKTNLQDKFNGINMGAHDYITKPFDPEELLQCVERVVANRM